MPDRVAEELRAELEAAMPEAWPGVARSVTARVVARQLLAALSRPPSAQSRLGWELRRRVSDSLREAA